MKVDQSYQDEWLRKAKEYRASGLSMKKYSMKTEINVYQLQYWVTKFKLRQKDDSERSFVKVKMDKPIISDIPMKLTYGKLSIEISDNFSEDFLLRVLKVVDQVV